MKTIIPFFLIIAVAGLLPSSAFAASQSESQSIRRSYALADGNYRVTVTLGSRRHAANTWVRAESRRLMLQDINTKKGELRTFTFTVHKRSPFISEGKSVKLKPRETDYLNWDDSLTLEFCGKRPAVADIRIEPDTSAVTLFLCGNSTVVDQETEPWASWGQMITRWWDDRVSIANYAESGERTTSFIAENRWAKVMSMAKKGDYIFVEFGHNDEKDRGAGTGAWYNFSTNLKRFIDEAHAAGCHLVLVTPTARRSFAEGHCQNTHGDYPDAVRAVAQREGVPLIDLTAMSMLLFDTFGSDGSRQLLVHYPANTFPDQPQALADNTHFNTFGAYEIAKCIVMGIKQLHLPFLSSLRTDWTDFQPTHPDDPQQWNWPLAGIAQVQRPDGN